MTHHFKTIFIRSYTIKVWHVLLLKTMQSCIEAVAKKLQHATLNCHSNKEKYLILCFETYTIF